MDVSPTPDLFSEILSKAGSNWFDIGVYLEASTANLEYIQQNYGTHGVVRCLIEVHKCLVMKGKLTWESIATALRRLDNHALAEFIHSNYILPAIRRASSNEDGTTSTTVQVPMDIPTSDSQVVTIKNELIDEIGEEFQSLSDRFDYLTIKIRRSFKATASLEEMQHVVEVKCGLLPLPENEATVEAVFNRLLKKCSILNFRPLMFAVSALLSNEETFQMELSNLKASVDSFNRSSKMVDLATLIKSHQSSEGNDDHKTVKLKLRDFWIEFTMEQFETMINAILDTLYDQLSHISVGTGCICVSWIISPSVNYTKLLPKLSLEFLRIIGVISLHIGDDVIYNVGEEGCQTLEAAMLQAIELKNTRAIELLLAAGCSPKVATYNEDHAVTNVVNIRKRSVDDGSGSGVDHVCVLGHNEHIEAIIDPSRELECATCRIKEKQIKKLHIHFERKDAELTKVMEQLKFKDDSEAEDSTEQQLRSIIAESTSLNSALTEQIKSKDAAFVALMRENEQLKEELKLKVEVKKEEQNEVRSLSVSPCTAVLPRQRLLGIGAEMKVKVITRNSDGKQLTNSGSAVRVSLTCNKEECPVTDNGDGTYLVSVVPQQLGQHHLSITVNGERIKDSPFTLNIIPQSDHTQLKKPTQTITGISRPEYIAFSDNGDMFVTSSDHCIHVYDKSGNRKATIGSSYGTGELQFQYPCGIDINNEVVYVAEYVGHRIHMLTTGGEFIGTFGVGGSGIGQFTNPNDVKISPDGRVYVADTNNDRVQIFNPDWTISHVIDNSSVPDGDTFSHPKAIAFDLSGNVHVGCISVTVFTPTGQFVRHYGVSELNCPFGLAIDPSGCSWATDLSIQTLDPNGRLVLSIEGLDSPHGVSVSPDGSVWVADTGDNRLVKYN